MELFPKGLSRYSVLRRWLLILLGFLILGHLFLQIFCFSSVLLDFIDLLGQPVPLQRFLPRMRLTLVQRT